MKVSRTAILAGAALVALAGISATASAESRFHVETIRLPDGAIEHIRYTGDEPPVVRLAPPSLADVFAPFPDLAAFQAPFVRLERLSAAMDRQAADMLRQANALDRRLATSRPGDWMTIDFHDLPAGARGYSTVSTFSDGHVCKRTTRYFSAGSGKAPRVETSTSGDCGGGVGRNAFHAAIPAPRPDPRMRAPAITVDYPHPTQHRSNPARLWRVSYPAN